MAGGGVGRDLPPPRGGRVRLAKRLIFDAVLAEEVTQEVFVRLWREPERYDPTRGSLRTFLLSVTHGRAIDILRSEMSRRAREERSRAVAEAGYDLEQEVFDLTTAERVREAVAKLPGSSAKRSSSLTSAATPIAKWPS